jgi:hypothetical protein
VGRARKVTKSENGGNGWMNWRGGKRRIGGSTAGGIGRTGEVEGGVVSGKEGETEVEEIKVYGFYHYDMGI